MHQLATTIMLRFAVLDEHALADATTCISVGDDRPDSERECAETRSVLDTLETADMIQYRGNYNCGVTCYTIRLTSRGQGFVAYLRDQATRSIERECEPDCGDIVRFGDHEGILIGKGAATVAVQCGVYEYEVGQREVTLVRRTGT